MNYSIRLCIALFICLIISSCKKKEPEKPQIHIPETKRDMLTTGGWKLVSLMYTEYGEEPHELIQNMDACDQDDILIYKGDNTLMVAGGKIKCDSTYPQNFVMGNWALVDNNTRIAEPMFGQIDTFEVAELSANVFKKQVVVRDSIYEMMKYVWTYTHVE